MFAASSSSARRTAQNRGGLIGEDPGRPSQQRSLQQASLQRSFLQVGSSEERLPHERPARSTRRGRRPRQSLRLTAGRVVLRILALALLVLVAWSILARPSGAHGPKTIYRVRPYDTLWTIAQSHYGGDARDGVWQIQQANHLAGTTLVPGERLVLP
jgi:hypothetical protein